MQQAVSSSTPSEFHEVNTMTTPASGCGPCRRGFRNRGTVRLLHKKLQFSLVVHRHLDVIDRRGAPPVILHDWHECIWTMEARLWYVLTGTRGGLNRIRIIKTLDEQPQNTNQIAEELDLHYKTVQHHLDVLTENDILENSGDDYGAIYLPTSRARNHWDLVEEIIEQVD